MNKPEFAYVTFIASTPEKVWEALTNGEFTRQYWGGLKISSDWNVGSPVKHVAEDGSVGWEGEVLEFDPPHVLSYTFHMLMGEAYIRERPSRVTYTIEPWESVVKLSLVHDDAEPGSVTLENTRNGWPAIMSSLKSLLETDHALPFTRLGFGPRDRR
jgi:uncharacterized protein YndB with AHSA1/START domain